MQALCHARPAEEKAASGDDAERRIAFHRVMAADPRWTPDLRSGLAFVPASSPAQQEPRLSKAAGEGELITTHLSVVRLAGERAYKLRRPLKLPFVDQSTPRARFELAAAELRVNARFAPEVYLGLQALRRDREGHWRFDAGEPLTPEEALGAAGADAADANSDQVAWAVVMRRLPADRMLDEVLARRAPIAGEALGQAVATWHSLAPRSAAIDQLGSPTRLQALAAANYAEIADSAHPFRSSFLMAGQALSNQVFEGLAPTLAERAQAGCILEGHGDLHARNLCLTEPPTAYDALEFSRPLRCSDQGLDLAFLLMDLEARGAFALARKVLHTYQRRRPDPQLGGVIRALIAYRAMVRAKVMAIEASQAGGSDSEGRGRPLRREARKYFRLATRALLEQSGPVAIVLSGLPASGKSWFRDALVRESGYLAFGTDRIRKTLSGVPLLQQAPPTAYSPELSARVYTQLESEASAALARGESVILDGNYSLAEERRSLLRRLSGQRTALGRPIRVAVVVLSVPLEVAQARLAQRAKAPSESDADLTVHEALRAAREELGRELRSEGGATVLHLSGEEAAQRNLALLWESLAGA